MSSQRPIPAFFGHHKCATTWVLGILRIARRLMGLRHLHYHSPKMFDYDLAATIEREKLDLVSYTSADAAYIEDFSRFRGFHIVRDPRDIVVSAYFSHRYSHSTDGWPELVEFRRRLNELSKDEGMLENIEFTARLPIDGCVVNNFEAMRRWNYDEPSVLELRFEDLAARPYEVILEALSFIGLIEQTPLTVPAVGLARLRWMAHRVPGLKDSRLPGLSYRKLPSWLVLEIIRSQDFKRLAKGRGRGQENVHSHYRKGKPGDWRNHFGEAHKEYFKAHYNDLLVTLGYERDDKW